jgi:predicted AlkP superfamily phosphohydrolase/phosphomutase
VRSRLLIFGIDGGTFNVLEPMWAEGRLPHLARLRTEGASGVLSTVCPPLTAPAWATFQTGLQPGRHGVFDFLAPPRLGYTRRLQNASALSAPRLFDTLSAAGRTVGALNVPLTFPPRPVNGFVVPGMLTPTFANKHLYPPSLGAELRTLGEYYVDMNPLYFEEGRDEGFVDELYRVAEARKRAALHLWRRHRPDFFAVVFTGVDRLMHFFWDRPELVRDHYAWLDATLGEFLASAQEEGATVFVLSDHGFGPAEAEVDLAAHLGRHGFLSLKAKRGPSPRRFLEAVAKLDLFDLRKRLPRRWRAAARGQVMDRLSVFAAVDWQRTSVFPGTATQYGVYLNVAGREPEGIVTRADYEKVREDFIVSLDELHPGLTARALRREEVYHGPFLDDAPDVYLPLWEDGVRLREFSDDPAVAPRRRRPGEHRREGIFFARGPRVTAGTAPEQAALADIYPTATYLMGEALPAGLDGRLLAEIIAPEALAETPPTYRDYDVGDVGYADGEDADVRARLEGMGYLG